MITAIIPATSDLQSLEQTVRDLVPAMDKVQTIIAGGGDAVAAWVADRPGLTHVDGGITEDPVADAVRSAEGDVLMFLDPGTALSKGWAEPVEKAARSSTFGLGQFQSKEPDQSGAYVIRKGDYSTLGGLPKGQPVTALPALAQNAGLANTPLNFSAFRAHTGGQRTGANQLLIPEHSGLGSLSSGLAPELADRVRRSLATSVMRHAGNNASVKTVNLADQSVGAALQAAVDGGADKVLLVDPQVPGLSPSIIEDALLALSESDLVTGPTHCGHCYLLGVDAGKVSALAGLELSLPMSENTVTSYASTAGLSVSKTSELQSCVTMDDFRHFYCSGYINL